ncbi:MULTISPECIES: hypothetical protein [unclassified Nonomuraea]|uniref:hypothetical protein n=1 Tax=unclassified Nonomuraea TaxID=2593643 RepID=UPI001376E938|nr:MULTISPECIES: hypothetical protein [unclassified Nonomuraea]NBE95921.1 hypothetical protein [Nonomuraea sp. K271]
MGIDELTARKVMSRVLVVRPAGAVGPARGDLPAGDRRPRVGPDTTLEPVLPARG